MRKIKILMIFLCAALFLTGMVSSASALTITPTTSPNWTGSETGNAQVIAAINIIMGSALPELYKANNDGSEADAFALNYSTTFAGPVGDYSGGSIKWDGGAFISASPLYVLVKDGNANPAWYLFELNATGAPSWDGKADLDFSGFWLGTTGSISHVALYGDSNGTTLVPEPLTLLLLGFGLVGLAGARRFRK
jgi:hypothetical protein